MLTLWSWWNKLQTKIGDEEGQTAVEYTLLLALVALAIILAQPDLRDIIKKIFTAISSGLTSAAS